MSGWADAEEYARWMGEGPDDERPEEDAPVEPREGEREEFGPEVAEDLIERIVHGSDARARGAALTALLRSLRSLPSSPAAEEVEPPADRFSAALEWAARAHAGQVYETADGPEPYVLHCLRVALAVDPEHRRVALLHDVLEDTEAGLPKWLPPTERTAARILSRRTHPDYTSYIANIARADRDGTIAGRIARAVKIADLRENLSHIRPGHRESLRARYEAALVTLGAEVQPLGVIGGGGEEKP